MVRQLGFGTLALGLIALRAVVGCGEYGGDGNPEPHSPGRGGETGEVPSGSGGGGGRVVPLPTGGSTGGRAPTQTVTGGKQGSSAPIGGGTAVTLSSPREADLAELEKTFSELDELDTEQLLSRYPTNFVEELGYDPTTAVGLDTVQGSALSLGASELGALGVYGFVISDRQSYPSFTQGYTAIYGEHLPLYISADSILNATHRSYDKILQNIEEASLVPRLGQLLDGLRSRLAAGAAEEFGDTATADADLYVTVAASLLAGELLEPAANGSAADIAKLYSSVLAADGVEVYEFFGSKRLIDFSQFKPRGHYTRAGSNGNAPLERYFRATLWLGLADLRLIETESDGSSVFRRRQLELAYALRALFDEQALANHRAIDETIRAFVGESDNMQLSELDQLLEDLGLDSAEGLARVDDQTLAQAIVDGGYGTQQISGHILENGTGGTVPLSSTFLLLGQRYVVDSHVFSNVVFGRVPDRQGMRLMPDPLDVAFGALKNDQAARLLQEELQTYAYAPELAKTRELVEANEPEFWSANLYNLWLSSLRALSPAADLSEPAALGLPAIAGTEAWGRRLLNTQLASWAELRHDTLLYAKQSYTDVPACEFPDGYVDPYPEFYRAIAAFAEHGQAVTEGLPDLADSDSGRGIANYFEFLRETATALGEIAEHQRTGTALTTEQVAFINRAVSASEDCFFNPNGWYPALVYGGGNNDTEFDPTIADVHTQPADAGGTPVGRVLHVGTGLARLMVVTVNTCSGPRAYVGLASSYFERITDDFERLTDPAWASEVMDSAPEDPPWLRDLVMR
jgi:Protein of unknown function (DUF3160)